MDTYLHLPCPSYYLSCWVAGLNGQQLVGVASVLVMVKARMEGSYNRRRDDPLASPCEQGCAFHDSGWIVRSCEYRTKLREGRTKLISVGLYLSLTPSSSVITTISVYPQLSRGHVEGLRK